MFWKIFVELCESKNEYPTNVVKKLNLSSGSIPAWKSGRIPRDSTLIKIANYFGVSVEYLLGKENPSQENSHSITIRGRDGSVIESDLTDEQIELFKQMLKQMTEKK